LWESLKRLQITSGGVGIIFLEQLALLPAFALKISYFLEYKCYLKFLNMICHCLFCNYLENLSVSPEVSQESMKITKTQILLTASGKLSCAFFNEAC